MIRPEAATRFILAVDHGTSGVKTALCDGRGQILAQAFRPTPLIHLPDGGVEQDPEAWWQALVETCRELVAGGAAPAEGIAAINCSSTYSSTVAVDASGLHLAPAMTWLDARGAALVARRMRGLINIKGYGLTRAARFVPISGGAPSLSGKDDIAHVLWWQHAQPALYERTHCFLGAKDYLNARLTGRLAASPDSVTLFWATDNRRIDRVRYHPGLIRALGIDGSKLPPIHPPASLLGPLKPQVAREMGLPDGVQVGIGAPDLQAATVGSGAVEDFAGHVYVGTSSWLLCHVPFKKTDVFHSIASLPAALPGRYFCANEQDVAGGCLTWLRDSVFFAADALDDRPAPDDAYARFDALAALAPPGAGGLLFTPWLNGERTPVDDHSLRGGFYNLGLDCDRARMVRAVFEGVAHNNRWVLGHVERFIKRPMPRLHMIGGGARSAVWCQIFADVLARPIVQVADPIMANARGAAFLASLALGLIDVVDMAALTPLGETFWPDPGRRALYDEMHRAFLALHRNNRTLQRRLNRERDPT